MQRAAVRVGHSVVEAVNGYSARTGFRLGDDGIINNRGDTSRALSCGGRLPAAAAVARHHVGQWRGGGAAAAQHRGEQVARAARVTRARGERDVVRAQVGRDRRRVRARITRPARVGGIGRARRPRREADVVVATAAASAARVGGKRPKRVVEEREHAAREALGG